MDVGGGGRRACRSSGVTLVGGGRGRGGACRYGGGGGAGNVSVVYEGEGNLEVTTILFDSYSKTIRIAGSIT